MIHSRKTGTDVIFIFKDHEDGLDGAARSVFPPVYPVQKRIDTMCEGCCHALTQKRALHMHFAYTEPVFFKNVENYVKVKLESLRLGYYNF